MPDNSQGENSAFDGTHKRATNSSKHDGAAKKTDPNLKKPFHKNKPRRRRKKPDGAISPSFNNSVKSKFPSTSPLKSERQGVGSNSEPKLSEKLPQSDQPEPKISTEIEQLQSAPEPKSESQPQPGFEAEPLSPPEPQSQPQIEPSFEKPPENQPQVSPESQMPSEQNSENSFANFQYSYEGFSDQASSDTSQSDRPASGEETEPPIDLPGQQEELPEQSPRQAFDHDENDFSEDSQPEPPPLSNEIVSENEPDILAPEEQPDQMVQAEQQDFENEQEAPHSMETPEPIPDDEEQIPEEEQPEQPEQLAEKEYLLDKVVRFVNRLKEFLTKFVSWMGGHFNLFKNCLVIFLVIALLLAGYFFGLYKTIYSTLTNLINPPKPPPVEVSIHKTEQDQFGISTVYLFAENRGSLQDRVPSGIKVAYYFGTLAEPSWKGETGITPVYYFGLLKDVAFDSDQFIRYVQKLSSMRELYRVDVYAMLDQTPRRSDKLLDYLANLRKVQEEGHQSSLELQATIDDLQLSYNSLSPDRARFETDFFDALQNLSGEKADFLLKSFVDVTQKQTALKAKISALEQLAQYYQTVLARLDIRIQAVDENRDALIQGIHVVDIPGADLDIIIKKS
jgi:chemotaxis protein histidine kinase CheA